MADENPISHDEELPLDWKRYCLRVDFYPPIKLERRDGLKFAEDISEYVELESVQPGVSEWNMAGGATCDGMHFKIGKHSIVLDAIEPPNNLKWYEHRFEPVLSAFGEVFSPQVALRRNAIVTSLVDLPESLDARSFLGGWVMHMHPNKLAPIERPLHVLGVRLFFPPFEEDGGEQPGQTRTIDWSVNVRVESCINDPGKLFLEANADWSEPIPWNGDLVKRAVQCLDEAQTFMSDKVVKFLRQPPLPDNGEDDDVQ